MTELSKSIHIKQSPEQVILYRKKMFQETEKNLINHIINYNKFCKSFNRNLKKGEKKKEPVKYQHSLYAQDVFKMYCINYINNHKSVKSMSKTINGKVYKQFDLTPMQLVKSIRVDLNLHHDRADVARTKDHNIRLEEADILRVDTNERNQKSIFLNPDILFLVKNN